MVYQPKLMQIFLKHWKLLFCIVVPIILLPLVFVKDDTKKFKCLYVILLMGLFWMFEALPLAITALFPIPLFPLLGIQSTSTISSNYMRETGMMFLGGITLALAIQKANLHKRIALNMMLLIGTSPWRVLLGIMVTTFTLSCWIVGNTAVTAMMIPIVSGLVDAVEEVQGVNEGTNMRVLYMLATGYAANIGGTAVMIGSIPNIIFKDLVALENIGQGGKYTEINFANWIAFNMPIALINLFIVWAFLGFVHLRQKPNKASKSSETDIEQSEEIEASKKSTAAVRKILREKLAEIGPMDFQQGAVSLLFFVAVALWFTRDPQIFKGWLEAMFPEGDIVVGDSSVAIILMIAMFIIPKDLQYFKSDGSSNDHETLMSWQYLATHFPWSVLFLVGGGFAISDGAERSGLSNAVGEMLDGLQGLPKPALLLVVLIVVTIFTEVMSNAATISLLTPILLTLSKRLGLHPLYISFAGAIGCQYAFILPTSNPPNALVFSAGNMRIRDMVVVGLPLNLICISVLYAMTLGWGQFLFKFSDYEYPVNSTTMTTTTAAVMYRQKG